MTRTWSIKDISGLSDPPVGADLVGEASNEGFHFIARLATEWRDGSNRFDGPGEVFLDVSHGGGGTIAVGGLNRDFSFPSGVARLRHQRRGAARLSATCESGYS